MATVGVDISHKYVHNDRGIPILSTVAKCKRCGMEASSYGAHSRSLRRSLTLLSEGCPRGESNWYKDVNEIIEAIDDSPEIIHQFPLKPGQQSAYRDILSGHNVFVTGPGGTGKSVLLGRVVTDLRKTGKQVAVTASTGISAINIGGVTIHSFLGTRNSANKKQMEAGIRGTTLKPTERWIQNRLRRVDTIVIDEVSMLTGDYLDMADEWLRRVCGTTLPFAGKQMVFVGDFLQLPPVQKEGQEFDRPFAFEADAWREAIDMKFHFLSVPLRQEDEEFVGHLLDIRKGRLTAQTTEYFQRCVGRGLADPTILFSHNKNVFEWNRRKLSGLETQGQKFKAQYSGDEKWHDSLKKNCTADDELILKVGAPILFIRNNWEKGYANGSRGIVHSFEDNTVNIQTQDHGVIKVLRSVWAKNDAYGKELAHMEQFPLKLAWAITIHRSQGMTLDFMHCDLSRCFERGQAYVAMSRARTVGGLSLQDPLENRHVRTDSRIVRFYEEEFIASEDEVHPQ